MEIGSVIGGYRLERLVGRGGMGVVYAASDVALDRAAAIDHPNVVPISSAGEEDGVLFGAMRFVAGDDLRTIVGRDRRRPLLPDGPRARQGPRGDQRHHR